MRPAPNENILGFKRESGMVTVHAWRKKGITRNQAPRTDCGRVFEWSTRTWLWMEYRSLNPRYRTLCKPCWGEK